MTHLLANGAGNAILSGVNATNELFTRWQRIGLIALAVGTYGVTAFLSDHVGIFADPGFGASLLLDPHPAAAMMKVAIYIFGVGVLCTFLGKNIRPDAGLFAAAIALLAIRRIGGTTRDVYLRHPNADAFLNLTAEVILLGLVLGAIYTVSRLLVAHGVIRDDVDLDSIHPEPEPLGQKLAAVAAATLTMAMGVLLTCQSTERMQVTMTVAICGLLASICVVRFIPATPSAWFWIAPIVVGGIGHVVGHFSPGANLAIGEPSGYAPALVRALPLDYASAGVAGSIYGYWIGRRSIPDVSLQEPTAG